MNPAIDVIGISKRYTLGFNPNHDLRDRIGFVLTHPQRLFVKKKKNEFWALRDISFQIMPGEILGIIGANGAGKSTLLKLLSRITPPTAGEIRIRGRITALLEIGIGFNPELTGRENVFLNGAIMGMTNKEIRKKFQEIANFSEIGDFIDTPIKYYSSGMYVRLAFAIASHLEPDILILDEVLSVGDMEFQKKSLSKVLEIQRKGKTILFASHNLDAVIELCSRTLLLHKGKLVAIGETQKVIKKYYTLLRKA
jgi:lipopolysaccharide transport system ATP-binding protein